MADDPPRGMRDDRGCRVKRDWGGDRRRHHHRGRWRMRGVRSSRTRRSTRSARTNRTTRTLRTLRTPRTSRLLKLRGGVFCFYYTGPNFLIIAPCTLI